MKRRFQNISDYERESLTNLYASLTFCEENELPTREIKTAIRHIEIKIEYYERETRVQEKIAKIKAKYKDWPISAVQVGRGGVRKETSRMKDFVI